MRTLILGGTVFLGRHVAAEAVSRGHELTRFTRGLHGADLFREAEHLRGDRSKDLSALHRREWDVVIDTSGYRPEDVAASSALLGDAHLVFVSSLNVYPAWPEEAVDEDSPVWTEGEDYGQQKAASERAAEAALPGRVASVRAGLICGPHDNVFRLPWWVRRIAAGGRVPAPGGPAQPVQLIDARDLASWMLELGERRVAGVEPWTELPLWLPEPATWTVGTDRAQASGLRCRPVAGTVADAWAWLRDGGEAELHEWRSEHRPEPMSPAREAELLAS